jgi:hypothetical protein
MPLRLINKQTVNRNTVIECPCAQYGRRMRLAYVTLPWKPVFMASYYPSVVIS